MKILKPSASIFLLGVIGFFVGYLSAYSEISYLPYTDYTDPALFLSLSLVASGILSFIVSEKISTQWTKMAYIFLVIEGVLVLLTPASTHIGDPTPTKEITSLFLSGGFFIWSILYLLHQTIKERKKTS
jgi:drug/metabolite transporter (DMT)-like permease